MKRTRSGWLGLALLALLSACTDAAGPIPGSVMPRGSAGTGGSSNPPTPNPDPIEPPPGSNASADPVSFDDDVHPILAASCSPCHDVPSEVTPGHSAADADAAFEAVQGMSKGEPVYERILARASGDDPDGFMPPSYAGCDGALGSPGCLSEAEFALIELWVEQGASNR